MLTFFFVNVDSDSVVKENATAVLFGMQFRWSESTSCHQSFDRRTLRFFKCTVTERASAKVAREDEADIYK